LTEADFNSCRKPASGKRVVQVPLKPDTDVEHLVVWISSITCKAFVWSGDIAASRKRVTVSVPSLVTPKQAFRLFLDALNSVGLTVLPSGNFFQVIETVRAKTKPIPLYDWNGHPLTATRP
jgi:general secretion pathway protein D